MSEQAAKRGIITYEGLPRSVGGAHSLGKMDVDEAWAGVKAFLTTCTDYRKPWKVDFQLATLKNASSTFVRKTRIKLFFRHGFSRLYAAIGQTEQIHKWNLVIKRVPEAIKELKSYRPFPEHQRDSPLVLGIHVRFRFTSKDSRNLMPFQEPRYYLDFPYDGYGLKLGQSEIYLRLSTHSSLFAFFCLPFEEPSDDFEKYRAFIQENFPVRLSDKHWKYWGLTNSRTSYRQMKLRLS